MSYLKLTLLLYIFFPILSFTADLLECTLSQMPQIYYDTDSPSFRQILQHAPNSWSAFIKEAQAKPTPPESKEVTPHIQTCLATLNSLPELSDFRQTSYKDTVEHIFLLISESPAQIISAHKATHLSEEARASLKSELISWLEALNNGISEHKKSSPAKYDMKIPMLVSNTLCAIKDLFDAQKFTFSLDEALHMAELTASIKTGRNHYVFLDAQYKIAQLMVHVIDQLPATQREELDITHTRNLSATGTDFLKTYTPPAN